MPLKLIMLQPLEKSTPYLLLRACVIFWLGIIHCLLFRNKKVKKIKMLNCTTFWRQLLGTYSNGTVSKM